jgi:isopenicillin-N epimerase
VTGTAIEGVDVSWDRLGDLFTLDPAVAHLNHGSFGAVPVTVQRTLRRLREEMEANPMAFVTRGLLERIADARSRLAVFLGADPAGTALLPNASAAAEVVLRSIRAQPDDEILLTDHGYGGIRLAVERLCRRTGAVLREVALPLAASADEVVTEIATAAAPNRTRLAIVDQVASPTAKLFPVARIVDALHDRGIPVAVDGAHAPGMLDVDVESIGADFWFGNLHKWAFGSRPTAVLVVAPPHRETVEPLVVSWLQEAGFPAAVEIGGTLDYTTWLAAPTGIETMRALGLDAVRRHNSALADYGQRVVSDALSIAPASRPQPSFADDPAAVEAPVSMRLVPLPPGVADDRLAATNLRERLAIEAACEAHIDVWCGRGHLRLSAQLYNGPDDYDRLAAALPGAIQREQRAAPTA